MGGRTAERVRESVLVFFLLFLFIFLFISISSLSFFYILFSSAIDTRLVFVAALKKGGGHVKIDSKNNILDSWQHNKLLVHTT